MKENKIIPKTNHFQSNFFALIVTITAFFSLLPLKSKSLLIVDQNQEPNKEKEIEIEWTIQQLEETRLKKEKFVEANPNSPINTPDKTNNFSFRDQQAAQPTTTPEKSKGDLPKVNGMQFSSKVTPTKIESPPQPQLIEQPQKTTQEKNEKKTIEQKARVKPKSNEIANVDEVDKNGLKIEEQKKDGRDRLINLSKNYSEKNPNDEGRQLALKEPKLETLIARRPRPKLSPDLLRGPVMKTTSNAPRVGMLAVECRLHPYGVYVQEMLRSIEDQWQQLAYNSLSFIQRDRLKNRISFRFILLADGSISNLKNLDSLDEFSLPAEICRQAIASRVPFGNWTPEMKDDFGESDTITIHFNYR
jgi:hypothetical protein